MKQRLGAVRRRAAERVMEIGGAATAQQVEGLREELRAELERVDRRPEVAELRRRVNELEAEVQECRQLNLRLAELTDLVQNLLLPVAARDEQRVAELMERYTKGL